MENSEQNVKTDDIIFQVVGFKLGEEEFVLDILKVQEIIKLVDITPVPNSPDFVEGVINLRGKVIPIVSLRKRFGFQDKEKDSQTRIIVVEIEKKLVGFIVDHVTEVLRIPSSTIEPPPPLVSKIGSEYLKGVGKLDERLLIVLDVDKILSVEEKNAIQKSF
jgi:purine-binding chemotaxis protein CheW